MLMFIMAVTSVPNEQRFMISLFQEYQKLMFSTAKKYVSDNYAAEDIVQESLISFLKNLHTIMSLERCSLAAYVVCTVRNTSINYLKKQGTTRKHVVPTPVENSEAEVSQDLPVEELLLLREDLHTLSVVLREMSEENRLLLENKYILGQSDEEIAEKLGCKPSSVRMKLTRARRQALSMMLKRNEGEKK